ncbi:hypothetical protein ABS71_14725 [bacterium SCN 62-11]|nr:MAG: hypothetical protein ABS71_14725 [bacterium SCN 62-11]
MAYQQSHEALDGTPETQNLRACVEARIGYSLADIDQRMPFFHDATQHYLGALPLSCLVPLSLARVRWMVCEPEASLEALRIAQQTPFREVPFFPRQTDDFHFLWEREPERREANTRWQIADLLAQLEPQRTVQHCRQALEYRPEAGVTWFRLGLSLPAGTGERLQALQEACRLHPAFGPARLAVARELADQGLREQLLSWMQVGTNLALAFPHLKGLKSGITRLLQQLAQPVEAQVVETVEHFALGITFDWLQPDEPIPTELSDRVGTLWERQNTRFPCDQEAILERFSRLDGVPRMSTLAIAALLQRVVAQMPEDQIFVNVGVWHGFTYLASLLDNEAKHCVGVDDFSQFGGPEQQFRARFERLRGPRHYFYSMDYQDYFRDIHQGKLGAYLYDGDHSYEHQLRGLQIAEPHFAPGCIVLVDDTNWDGARQASLDFVAQSARRYELIFDVRTAPNLAPSYWNGYHPTWWNGWMMWRCLD